MTDHRNTTCAFCRTDCREVGPLVEGPGEIYICDSCVERYRSILHLDKRPEEINVPLSPQLLAACMTESMKILQLPITTLRERIQQELQEGATS